MEDVSIRKDETPYLVFACKKCKEFSYVKTAQKTRKCLRCGRAHQVRDILEEGEVVIGMTEAVNTVKRKQNELAIPEFRSGSDFVIATNKISPLKSKVNALKNKDQEIDYNGNFTDMLLELSKLYRRFPRYMLEIMAEDHGIPAIELEILIETAKKSGKLIKNGDNDMYFKYNK